MATRHRKQANVLLILKVLYFVSQLGQHVEPRVQRGFDCDLQLGIESSTSRKVFRRFPEGLSRLGARDAKQPQHIANRIRKCRRENQKMFRPARRLHASGLDGSDYSNESGEEVQQYVERSFRFVSSTKLLA